MKIEITIDETDLRRLVAEEIRRVTGNQEVCADEISILVKSKQNYKSEWEQASFKAEYKANS